MGYYLKNGSLLLFKLRILDASVIDGHELVGENLLGDGEVAEGDGTLVEVALLNLRVDDA